MMIRMKPAILCNLGENAIIFFWIELLVLAKINVIPINGIAIPIAYAAKLTIA
jgi:hypothetical protein